MVLAEPSDTSQRNKRNLLFQMFLDIAGDCTHLPTSETAATRSRFLNGLVPRAEEFVHQHIGERFRITSAFWSSAANHAPQFRRGLPKDGILDEDPWRVDYIGLASLLEPDRVEVFS